jgi:hypothetical protein
MPAPLDVREDLAATLVDPDESRRASEVNLLMPWEQCLHPRRLRRTANGIADTNDQVDVATLKRDLLHHGAENLSSARTSLTRTPVCDLLGGRRSGSRRLASSWSGKEPPALTSRIGCALELGLPRYVAAWRYEGCRNERAQRDDAADDA